jgi:ABC-type spermidine/putrescine transport system permease subunit II
VLAVWAVAVFLFLYVPIVIVVVYAFNANRHVTLWTGFSTHWFGDALRDPAYTDAVAVSLKIALTAAVASTVVGTAAALGLARARRAARVPFDVLVYLTLAVPEVVIAVASLTYYVQIHANDPSGAFPTLGWRTIALSHMVFGASLVTLIVRARFVGIPGQLAEASFDLGAGPVATFRQITLPQLAPAIVGGFLLAFVFSFDDYVTSVFTAGTTQTWPMVIYSSVRFGISPKVNALAAVMLVVTLTAGLLAALALRRPGLGRVAGRRATVPREPFAPPRPAPTADVWGGQ